MPNYAADDTDFIAKRMKQLEKEKTERINDGAPEAEGSAQNGSSEEPTYMGKPIHTYSSSIDPNDPTLMMGHVRPTSLYEK